MMERTSLAMGSIPLTKTENARIGYGALGRPGVNRSKPLNPSAQPGLPATAPVAAASSAPTPAAQPAGDAVPINPANAPAPSTIDAALAGVAADKAYRGRNTLLEGMPKPTAAFTGQVEQPARGSEEERVMMERTSLAMGSIPLTPTQKARMPYGALGRPGVNRSKPLNPSALSEPAPKEPEPDSLTAR